MTAGSEPGGVTAGRHAPLGLSSSGCCNRIPQTGGLNNKHLFVMVLEAEVRDQGASQHH